MVPPDTTDPAGEPTGGAAARTRWLLPLALGLIAALWFQLGRDASRDGELDVDEAEWLSMSIHSFQLLATGESRDLGASPEELAEAASDPWRLGIADSTFGWMNPLLPKLVLGAVAQAQGFRLAHRDVFLRFLQDEPDPAERARARLVASQLFVPALGGGRAVTTLLAAGVAALLFAAGRSLGGTACGLVAWLLWIASPAAREAAQHVRTDLFPLVFSLAALAFALARRESLAGARGARAQIAGGLVLGVLAGLAVGSKLNGALVAVAVGLWLPALWLLEPADRRTSLARGLLPASLAAGASCVALFALLDVAAWPPAPLDGLSELVRRWDQSMVFNQRRYLHTVEIARDLPQRVSLALRGTLDRDEPLRALTGLPLGAPLLIGGLLLLGRDLARDLARRRGSTAASAALVVLAWIAVVAVGTTLWLPMDWERFFLPYLPCMILLEAVLAAWLLERLRVRFRARA